MFSFHKPKVYRSSTGCCICKAKSSSSRFTDSKKYELDFIECFQLVTPRKGEICNACVLLVKRFKRLPPGSDRHWGHVVDARVGPGLKSMTKFKKRKEDAKEGGSSGKAEKLSMPERFCKIFKKKKKVLAASKEEKDHSGGSSDEDSSPNSPDSASVSDGESTDNMLQIVSKSKRKGRLPMRRAARDLDIIDLAIWRRRETCCGLMYESLLFSALLVDTTVFKPCKLHCKSSPVSELERELTGLGCNADDLLIKLTDEQIQENGGFNKITKLSELFGSSSSSSSSSTTTALKKHQMYSKRNCFAEAKTDLIPPAAVKDPLHKIKADTGGKILKNSLAALKLRPLDFKMKDLVKICAEKAVKSRLNGAGGHQEGVIGDNSSDSGYEESLDAQVSLCVAVYLGHSLKIETFSNKI